MDNDRPQGADAGQVAMQRNPTGPQGQIEGQGQGPRQGKGPGQGQRQGQGKGKGPGQAPVIQVLPIAEAAVLKRRHWGLFLSLFAVVLVPLAAIMLYLWMVAVDQYSSTTGFTVRQEESGGATDLLGGLAQFAGSPVSADSNILFEYIQSQEIVQRVDDDLDLKTYYATHWDEDPLFTLWPDASTEDLLWYWQRVVRVSHDQSTGLIDLQVLAFDADMAQNIAQAIVRESQDMINALNNSARDDAMGYAVDDLNVAIARLKDAREALTRFRTETQIVDPVADIQGRMGVLNNLQQQLAEALIDNDLLLETTTNANDARLLQARRRIEVIRDRIADERKMFASDGTNVGELGEDYPTLIAEFESLSVDREVAEETYRAALTAMDVARANASRQSRYLATYVKPTLADASEFPRRFVLTGLAALFLGLSWAIMALVYYSIRDRS